MNPSEKIVSDLIQARSRQHRLHLIAAAGALLSAFLVWGVFVFSNGVSVEVLPEGARENSKLGVVGGLGFSVGNTAYSAFGPPRVQVSSPGFQTEQKQLTANDIGKVITIRMTELPGSLEVSTNPESDLTRWTVDEKLAGVSKALKHEVFSGAHTIVVDSPYFQKKSVEVVMGRGETREISVELQKIAGQLDISSLPLGAEVFVDGVYVGKTPVLFEREGGAYQIEVQHPGYESVAEKIEVTNSATKVERQYRLAHKMAYLKVSASPRGGTLLLNGKKVNHSEEVPVKANVENSLTYAKAGYFSKSKRVKLDPGIKQAVSLKLQPEFGKVELRSSSKASVYANGRLLGETPLNISLKAISQKIEVKRTGYRSQRRTITPSSKSVQTFSANMETELAARLRESPKELSNSVGMKMKLFEPNDRFVMGAPRHEKGQRANEFLRKVKLTKPFFISAHEVTKEQFSRFAKGSGSSREPVSSVSWIKAAEFCNWLSQKEGFAPFYRLRGGELIGTAKHSDGYRLPSEAEWEWLARKAGRKTQVKFTWGDDATLPPMSGNIADEKAKGTTPYYVPNYTDGYAAAAPVGTYPADASGLHDLTGNVSEWVHDVYSLIPPNKSAVELDPLGSLTGDSHVVKGSNWRSGNITELRASYREGAKAGSDDIGFRVARYLYGGPYVKN